MRVSTRSLSTMLPLELEEFQYKNTKLFRKHGNANFPHTDCVIASLLTDEYDSYPRCQYFLGVCH